MQFKNFLNLFESYHSNKNCKIDYKTKSFFEGAQETFALSLLNNDQNILNELKPHIEEKHLPVAAYWLSKRANINQVLEIMQDYVELADKNIIKANVTKSGITLDYKNKKQEPIPNFIVFVNTVHGIQQRQKFNNPRTEDIEIDAENLKVLHNQNNITVYEANSPQACVTLGRGHSFCISKPGGTMWQSYRDSKTSTFYFVKDQNRDFNDPLRLVVVDMTEYEPELTDLNNTTGNIAEYGENTERYFEYLSKMGVPTDIFENIPKSPQEEADQTLLGRRNKYLNWFKELDIFQQSKYIGRGHQLTDEQFDYLWNENEQKLLNQYVSIGRLLLPYQLNKIASKTSLKNSYFRAREQVVSGGHGKYHYDEYLIMSPEQKNNASNKGYLDFNDMMFKAAKDGNVDLVELVIKKGVSDFDLNRAMETAAEWGKLAVVKFLVEKGAKNLSKIKIEPILNRTMLSAARHGHLEIVELMIEKGANDFNRTMYWGAFSGSLKIVELMIEKGADDFNEAMSTAATKKHFDIVELMIKKGANNFTQVMRDAVHAGSLDVVKLMIEKGEKYFDINDFNYGMVNAARDGSLDIVKLMVEKGARDFDMAIRNATRTGHQEIVDYLKNSLHGNESQPMN